MKFTSSLILSLGFSLGFTFAAEDSTHSGIYLVSGLTMENGKISGWYDANKENNNDGDADDNMCYAASAANIIAWWQNNTPASTLTSNSPKELGSIWQTFINASKEEYWSEGGDSLSSINWWISGVYFPESLEDTDAWERYYMSPGDLNGETIPLTLRDAEGYYFDQYGLDSQKLSSFLMNMNLYSEHVTTIDFAELLQKGAAVSLIIHPEDSDDGHVITLWGVEYDEAGKLKKIWITDSDDSEEDIVELSVTVDEEGDKIWLGDEYFANKRYYIISVCAVNARESFKWSTLSATTYVNMKINPQTLNGRAGAALLADVFMNEESPIEEAPEDEEEEEEEAENGSAAVAATEMTTEEEEEEESALESIIDAMDYGAMNDRDAAAVAGASTSILAQALSSDVERQLNAIRNRAAMGYYCQDTVFLDSKGSFAETPDRFFAWVNAEGNRAKQKADGSAAGYTLLNWGGTVGSGMKVNNQLSIGLAVTAMYGDLKSDGPDSLDGDMDTAYLSAFAHYHSGNWRHSFIGTLGFMETDYKRTVMGYTNHGDTEGTTFGLMYEGSREHALNDWSNICPVFNISFRHIAVDSYTERGTNAALNVGEQKLDTVTLGLGVRYNAVVGKQALNRDCFFESHALLKFDLGDTQTDTTVGIVEHATRTRIESAERSPLGLELGAGICVPVGYGNIFADGSVQLRHDYTNFNATLGYKIQF